MSRRARARTGNSNYLSRVDFLLNQVLLFRFSWGFLLKASGLRGSTTAQPEANFFPSSSPSRTLGVFWATWQLSKLLERTKHLRGQKRERSRKGGRWGESGKYVIEQKGIKMIRRLWKEHGRKVRPRPEEKIILL